MKTVVFLVYHGMGHFNACFRMAKILGVEYDVVFAGVEHFKNYVEGQGFMYYPLKTVPFAMGFEHWISKQKKNRFHYIHILKDRWTNTLYDSREGELLQLMYDVEPDYLFIDAFQSSDFIILCRYLKENKTKVAFIQTMLPTIVQHGWPPLNSLALPGDKEGIKNAIQKFLVQRLKKIVLEKLKYLGMDNTAILNRSIRHNRLPKKYISHDKSIVGTAFNHVTEFVMAPPAFDFPNAIKRKDQHYIGFIPDLGRIEISDVEYFKRDLSIRQKAEATQAKLIYCAFGSVESKDTEAVKIFLEKLFNVVKSKNYVLIISSKSIHHAQHTFSGVPDNVFIFKAAPQLQVLARADAFITHGGINSIKESIYLNVPMLVYPLHNATDTMGNSSRIVHHRLGLRGDLAEDSEENIADKLHEILHNDSYRKNLFALREADEQYSEKFMHYFSLLKSIE